MRTLAKFCYCDPLRNINDRLPNFLHYAPNRAPRFVRTRAFFEALRRGLINSDELDKAAQSLESWIESDRKRFRQKL